MGVIPHGQTEVLRYFSQLIHARAQRFDLAGAVVTAGLSPINDLQNIPPQALEEVSILAKLSREGLGAARAQRNLTARQRGGGKLQLLEPVLEFRGLVAWVRLLHPTQQLHALIAEGRNGL